MSIALPSADEAVKLSSSSESPRLSEVRYDCSIPTVYLVVLMAV